MLQLRVALASVFVLACQPGTTETDTDAPTSGLTGGATEPTGGGEQLLAGCTLDDPCAEFSTYCDFDGCAGDLHDAGDECTWTHLRDGTVARLAVKDGLVGDRTFLLVPTGDAERTVLREYKDGEVKRCTLKEAAFFQGCIDDPENVDNCYDTAVWYSCPEEPEAAPACP
jgi:hypothetical protein